MDKLASDEVEVTKIKIKISKEKNEKIRQKIEKKNMSALRGRAFFDNY